MKKVLFFLLAVSGIILAVNIQTAAASSFQFYGLYSLTNPNPGDGFSESLVLGNSMGVTQDNLLKYVTFLPLTLDADDYTPGTYDPEGNYTPGTYPFAEDTIVDGFQGFDKDGNRLFTSTIHLNPLEAAPNSTMVLISIIDLDVKIAGSDIVDDFGQRGTLTINFLYSSTSPFAPETGCTLNNKLYQGTAASIPEPSTLLLLGFGIFGFLGLGVWRKQIG